MDSKQAWPRCPEGAAFFEQTFRAFAAANPPIEAMAARFLQGAGVDILNLVDHWVLPDTPDLAAKLTAYGMVAAGEDDEEAWEHPQARLPRVRLSETTSPRLVLAVEDLARFLNANTLTPTARSGDPDSRYEEARCPLPYGELGIVVRQGYKGFRPGSLSDAERERLDRARAAFRARDRSEDEQTVIEGTRALFARVAEEIGPDRATDEFFAAERDYYMTRNRAARWQYDRQQEFGFGWANHDHHTYRCSRSSFRALMQVWRTMGFAFRERFYAGAEAGWGAQIVEHPVSRVVIFSDVDLAPEELNIDFTNQELISRKTLGTIGLWCALHGNSIGKAGMHHLEAEFDFVRAQANLEAAGFGVMAPFTDLPMLKQAFTEPELWQVDRGRAQALIAQGAITSDQAERFATQGAPGSHLEILQRWEGFKGFNKTGVSAIILETDARKTA